jgi:hypothetical protein
MIKLLHNELFYINDKKQDNFSLLYIHFQILHCKRKSTIMFFETQLTV